MTLKRHSFQHIHFVGIGGVGMRGIAEVLFNEGYKISGSDLISNSFIQKLLSLGVKIYFNHCSKNINNADLVVFSSAISKDNPEICAAHQARIPVIHRSEMLAKMMQFRYGIAISGTHGKTTTTAMIASIYIEAGLDPTFINGGLIKHLNQYSRLGYGHYLIVEADESDASFLYLTPIISVVTNIEDDHMDTYKGNFERLKQSFIKFLHNLPVYGRAIVCLDNAVIQEIIPYIHRKVITYGFSKNADIQIREYKQTENKGYCTLIRHNKKLLHIKLNIPGRHNALNAAAAVAAAIEQGVKDETIMIALERFQGIARRFDFLGEFSLKYINGKSGTIILIEDYGHHPTEIKETIKTVREGWPKKRLIMLFQPHRFTRTKNLYNQFVNVLTQVDVLLILDIYAAGEKPILGVNSYSLCQTIRSQSHINPILISNPIKIRDILSILLKENDIVLVQGAGNIGEFTKNLSKIKLKKTSLF